MKTRSRIDIISQILETANGGITTKIKIMYRANLSYAQLKGYLMTLSDKGLLLYDLDTNTFKTTEKGLKFLEFYNMLDNVIRGEEEGLPQQISMLNREGLAEK
jgi:predicted transcriptional regulator